MVQRRKHRHRDCRFQRAILVEAPEPRAFLAECEHIAVAPHADLVDDFYGHLDADSPRIPALDRDLALTVDAHAVKIGEVECLRRPLARELWLLGRGGPNPNRDNEHQADDDAEQPQHHALTVPHDACSPFNCAKCGSRSASPMPSTRIVRKIFGSSSRTNSSRICARIRFLASVATKYPRPRWFSMISRSSSAW